MTTNSINPTIAWICGTVLLLVILGGAFALAWHGSITGAALLGVLGVIVGIAGGALGVHAGVTAASNVASSQPPPAAK